LTSAAEAKNNNMSICGRRHETKKTWNKREVEIMILYTEKSVKASVPPGRRRRNASLTKFTITLVGHS